MSLELHETEFAWQQPLASGARFPAALVAAPNATVTPATGAAWFGANRDAIEAACARSGALLVRGAGLRSAEDFDAALRASGYDFQVCKIFTELAFGDLLRAHDAVRQMTAHVGGGGPRLPVLGEGSPGTFLQSRTLVSIRFLGLVERRLFGDLLLRPILLF